MSTHRFSPGNPFRWQNGTYEVQRVFPETDQVNIEDVFTGAVRLVERAELVRDWLAGELEFVPRGKDTRRERENGAIDLSDYPERLVAIARYRYAVIEPLTKLGLSRIPNSMIRERIVEFQKANPAPPGGRSLLTALSLRSVRRWVRDYQEGGHDIRALIPNTRRRGGKGKSRLDEELNAVVEAAIRDKCFRREPTTVDDVLHEVAVRVTEENRLRAGDEPLGLPARATVARRIAALDPRERYAARHGQRAARQAFKQYGQTEYPTVPLERVEIDHTKSDLVVLHDEDDLPLGRLTFTYCLDMATRYPLGYYLGFEPPSVLAVMECLYHAILPKEDTRERYGTEHEWLGHGVPSMLVVDNGREFIGQDLDDACLSLGIVLLRAPVATPYFKAGVERAFRTLNTQLFHTLPGTTFSNVRQRGDYKSEEQACVYLSEVDRIMNLYIVDIYAGREHRGLEGIPARRWEQAVQAGFSPRLPASAADLQILLGRVEYRVIHHYGVEFEALRYNCPDLAPLRARLKGAKAKIKYHPGDISRLWVFDPFEGEYIEVPALGQEYAQGLSLWKHRVIRNAVLEERGEVDLAALGRAKRKIQEIVREGKHRRRAGSRSRCARWDTAGQPTRKLAPARQAEKPALPASQPAQALPSPEPAADDLAEKPGEGWELSFDLPRTRQDEVSSN